MKRSMISILIIIFVLVVLLVSCNNESKKGSEGSLTIERYVPETKSVELEPGDFEELEFIPPAQGEEIVLEEEGLYDPKTNKILIYKKMSNERDLLFTIKTGTNFSYIRKNRGNIYFTMEDSDIYNDPQHDLWEIDITRGVIKNTNIRIGNNYYFSEDERYICYLFNDYQHNLKSINSRIRYLFVKLLDLESGVIKVFDFYDTFPLTRQAATCEIEALKDRFKITYFADGGGVTLEGYILLSDKEFYQTK